MWETLVSYGIFRVVSGEDNVFARRVPWARATSSGLGCALIWAVTSDVERSTI